MDIIIKESNHGSNFQFQEPMNLLIGLRHPRSDKGAADGAFVIAQETITSPIHTCVFVDGVRFTSIITADNLRDRVDFLTSIGWEPMSESDLGLVCFGMSHVHERDIFWKSEFLDNHGYHGLT